MKNSTKKTEVNLSEFTSSLNFAFCPSTALIGSQKLIKKNKEIKSLINGYPNQSVDDLSNAFRYFYICYSMKVEGVGQENSDYFYFQLYSQMGSLQKSEAPIYGFFENEKILSMIEEIDEMFDPRIHNKKIIDSYVDELISDTDSILTTIKKWTDNKLLEFDNYYFQDKNVIDSLRKIIENDEKSKISSKKTKKINKKNENI